jgi:hypothetical protein
MSPLKVINAPVIFLLLVLASCGGSGNSTTDSSTDSTVEESSYEEPITTEAPTTTALPTPTTFAGLTDRAWKLLVKNPDASIGKGVRVAATIFQFDANTGPTTFLANGFPSKAVRNSYGGDIIRIDGSEADLAQLLEDDKITCECVVMGAYNYSTKAGGSNTAIWFFAKRVIPG